MNQWNSQLSKNSWNFKPNPSQVFPFHQPNTSKMQLYKEVAILDSWFSVKFTTP